VHAENWRAVDESTDAKLANHTRHHRAAGPVLHRLRTRGSSRKDIDRAAADVGQTIERVGEDIEDAADDMRAKN